MSWITKWEQWGWFRGQWSRGATCIIDPVTNGLEVLFRPSDWTIDGTLSAGQKVIRSQGDYDTVTFSSSKMQTFQQWHDKLPTLTNNKTQKTSGKPPWRCALRNKHVCFEIQLKHMVFSWCTCTINKSKCQRRSRFCFSNFPTTTLHSKTKEQRKPQDVKSKMFKPSTQALSKAQIILLSVSEQLVRLTKISKEGFALPIFFF